MKQENETGQTPTKQKRSSHCHSFKLNEKDNTLFAELFTQSGIVTKTKFICSILFNRPIKVVTVDKSGIDFCVLLTDFYNQYRSVGVNYNQVVKKVNASLSQDNAAYYIAILKKHTIEMISISEQIFRLSKAFEQRWSQK